jgi:TRAP-type C4-dicarboxylate transport system permease small subunit
MVVVTVDVVGRYIFNAPLHGSFEYIQICMALIVFIALPVIVVREENVQVEVFEVFIPKTIRPLTRMLGSALTLVIVAGLVWIAFKRAASFHESGERFVLLPAPLYPVAYFIFAMWLVCLGVMILQFVKYSKRIRETETEK